MQTLSKGFKKPENPDTGDIFFDAVAFDIQQLNDHTHNGTDSQLLASTSQTILSASWAAVSGKGGLYKQTVTVPSGFSYDTCNIWWKLSSGEYVFPTIERASSTTYVIYTGDNSLTYTAFYR